MQVLPSFVIPAQIRAARALLNLSQEDLAAKAEVGLSTLREIEAQRRPIDSALADKVRRTLDNFGVIFVEGDAAGGPGVRLAAHRPNLVRRPTVVTAWDGVPLEVELQGRRLTVFVARDALAELDDLSEHAVDAELLAAFERHSGRILDALASAANDPANYDRNGHLRVHGKDVFEPAVSAAGIRKRRVAMQPPDGVRFVRIRPQPHRVWQGVEQEPRDDRWRIDAFTPEKGILVIANSVTGHFIPLYEAHVHGFEDDAAPDGSWVLRLNVQMVFEDGLPRLEWQNRIRQPSEVTGRIAKTGKVRQ